MKILLLSAYMMGSFFFQQDGTSATSATSAKRADRSGTAQQQQSTTTQNTGLNATHAQPVQKQKASKNTNVAASPLNGPAKSSTPKN